MLKRIGRYALSGMLVLGAVLCVACFAVKRINAGRIAPGVMLCGRDLSGMTPEEVKQLIAELLPETVTELRCRYLPEMREEINAQVRKLNEEGHVGVYLAVSENEVCLTAKTPMFRAEEENLLQAAEKASSEVKTWEWLYAAVTGCPFRVRTVEPEFAWEKSCFEDYVALLSEVTERERKDATVCLEQGQVKVTESERGFRLDTERLQQEAETVAKEALDRLRTASAEGMVLRFYVNASVLMPRLTTEQAERCNTVIGTFSTSYAGAAGGREQNIKAGAEKLHGTVVLPGEIFSVANVLMPFTEENGYAEGGTYIGGQLSESIGGGVCQLSSTLYNALLHTKLEITERYPHSMPVGYVPLGQDAAIAGDYKDLKFKNTTKAPVLVLCEATGTEVKVAVYGEGEAKREGVSIESIIMMENEERIAAEVYRIEVGDDGEEHREKVSGDVYQVKKRQSQ